MIFGLAINILYTFIAPILFFDIFLVQKSKKRAYAVPIILFAIWQCIVLMHVLSTAVIICVNILFLAVIASVLYEGNIFVKVAFAVLFTTVGVLIEFFVGYVFILLSLPLENASIFGLIISKILSIGMFFVFKYMRDRSNILSYSKKYSIVILIVPIISLILMYVVFTNNLQGAKEVDISLSLLLVGILIFTNIIVLKVYQLLIRETEIKAKHEQYVQQFQMKEEHNEEIELMIDDIRKTNHEIKSHLITLRGYLYEKKIDEAYSYIDDLLEDTLHNTGISRTGNVAIDSIINSKYIKMKKQNIAFEQDVNIPIAIPFHGADLSILIGNILNNAIEASEKVLNDKKFIDLHITYQNNYLVISCINAYNGELVKNKYGMLQTIKKDRQNHGYGIAAIKSVCEKYKGYMNLEHNTDTFTLKLVLFINSQNDK